MTKVKKFLVGAIMTFLLAATALASIPAFSKMARAVDAQWSSISVQEEYFSGEILKVPSRTLTIDGTQVDSQIYVMLTLPDGQRITPKGEVVLEQIGKYTLAYTARHENINYKDEVDFRVYSRIASVSSDASSFAYGSNPYMQGYDANDATKGNKGINVKLAYGDTFQFDSIIDLKGKTKYDNILEFLCTPQTKAKKDLEVFMIRLTDITDPNNYIQIKIHSSSDGDDWPSSYFLAGGNGQAIKGYEESWNRLHVNNEWGTPIRHSFQGDDSQLGWLIREGKEGTDALGSNDYLDDTPMRISYDEPTKTVYVHDANNAAPIKVIDLDDPEFYGSNTWSGFKSNKVKLSIQGDLYATNSAWFCITKAMGVDVSKDKAEDKVAPTVSVVYPQNDSANLPKGKVGFYYPIFDIDSYDNYFTNVEEKVSVWKIDSKGNAFSVSVDDGKFLVDEAVKYRIDYTVTDGYGNSAKESVFVQGYDAAEVPTVSLSISSTSKSLSTGELIDIQPASYFGGTGELTLKYTYSFNGGERVSVSKKGFVAEKPGTYEVFYTVTDYIGQVAEKKETITVTNSDKPVFGKNPVLPMAVLSGSTYYLDDYYASFYSAAGVEQIKATAELIDSNGTTAITGASFKPVIAKQGDTVSIKYTATHNGVTNSKTFEIPGIMQLNRYNPMTNYFISEAMTLTAASDNILMTATSSAASSTFAKTVLDNSVRVQLGVDVDNLSFQAVQIILTDSRDENVKVTSTIYNREFGTFFGAQGKEIALTDELGFKKGTDMNFEYDKIKNQVSLEGFTIAVTTTDDGEDFTGFASGKVYVTLKFVGASSSGAAIELKQINNQIMSSALSDKFAPELFVLEDRDYAVDKGAYIQVPKAVAGDVLAENITFTVSVTNSNGGFLKDTKGVTLNAVPAGDNYTFYLESYGTYSIKFVYDDGVVDEEYNIAVYAEDRTPPELSFSQDFKKEVNVGEKIIVPNFTAVDNNTASGAITKALYIRTSDGLLVALGSTNTFIPKYTGVYQILICATDGEGNVKLHREDITVR